MATTKPRTYQTTSPRGLDHDRVPMRLWQKAKRLGAWDPREIDFSQDRSDWEELSDDERDLLLRLTSLFQAGEEAVTLDLLPLILVVAREGRLEEEIYLTSFLYEEAKHVEAFRRFFDEVARDTSDLSRYHTPSYRAIFYDALPSALERLHTDDSPIAQAEASTVYHMVVEGILAETGYHGYHTVLSEADILPGMQALTGLVKRDESRHLAFGVYFLSRLVAEHGDPVWTAIEDRMNQLLVPALGTIDEIFGSYAEMPFGLEPEAFTEFALSQFQKRVDRIERARTQSPDEVLYGSQNA